MLWNLLEETTEKTGTPWTSYILIIALVAIIVVFMVINSRSAKKRQQETQNMLDAIRPGNKVKTIGGICGVVVEVDPEDNTFVLETGTEASGKSYIKFDKQAVYQTDAVAPKTEKVETQATEEPVETVEVEATEEPVETVEEKTEE
ncbi:MAG: preprotein translocase subunit YajC [Clostridia bacterium]|nr:preprotein translocase subunit YajC [Clostridia bacterium]